MVPTAAVQTNYAAPMVPTHTRYIHNVNGQPIMMMQSQPMNMMTPTITAQPMQYQHPTSTVMTVPHYNAQSQSMQSIPIYTQPMTAQYVSAQVLTQQPTTTLVTAPQSHSTQAVPQQFTAAPNNTATAPSTSMNSNVHYTASTQPMQSNPPSNPSPHITSNIHHQTAVQQTPQQNLQQNPPTIPTQKPTVTAAVSTANVHSNATTTSTAQVQPQPVNPQHVSTHKPPQQSTQSANVQLPPIPPLPLPTAATANAITPINPFKSTVTQSTSTDSSRGLADHLFDFNDVVAKDSAHDSSGSVPSLSTVGSRFTDLLPDLTVDDMVKSRDGLTKEIRRLRRKNRKLQEKVDSQKPTKRRKKHHHTDSKSRKSKKRGGKRREPPSSDSDTDDQDSTDSALKFTEEEKKAAGTIYDVAELNRKAGKTVRKIDFRTYKPVYAIYSDLAPRLTKEAGEKVFKKKCWFTVEGGKPHIHWDPSRPLAPKPKPKPKGKGKGKGKGNQKKPQPAVQPPPAPAQVQDASAVNTAASAENKEAETTTSATVPIDKPLPDPTSVT